MHNRYIENTLNTEDLEDFLQPNNLQRHLVTEIEYILARLPAFPIGGHTSSIYHGQAGILYLLFHIHNVDPSVTVAGDPVAELCEMYLTSITKSAVELNSKHCGFIDSPVGAIAVAACVHHVVLRKDYKARLELEKLLEYQSVAINDAVSDELLYGRVGYLYALQLVSLHCSDIAGDLITDDTRLAVIKKVIEHGQKGAIDGWPLMWSWHDRHYLGAAHGVGVLLQCGSLVDPWKEDLLTVADRLSEMTLTSGNVPSSLSSHKDELVQFCHGAPGVIPCLTLIDRLYPGDRSKRILSFAEKQAKCIWERGILNKSAGLCHGISGNAFAFLELYSVCPDSPDYLKKAAAFCRFACEWREHTSRKVLHTPDHPNSLFEGNAGLAWLLIDLWWIIQQNEQRGQNQHGSQISQSNLKERPGGYPCFTDLI
ncbi:hypothetical protein K450DRAFT_228149 [Umbelopsis ramanniana AG]|uniref:Uncharacterized protein n=1 Tax=Umbelopsis ramanniana AG TaxID=1314678 RepID=A0AAD5HGM6_UMBRA|nr:uncharacterized protein K450DRAFT_228149 [Umbelopsis ramanniana AG]KAI8582269.1 hypothetical protein K450DRAFT_228149 [Umbelopsis ramanniana AG]